ncbi:ScbR family autoregulator-binding transcription factor [Streptomyces sp. NPDC001604]|uniref:ScbR family autoregulator-binding transcription factor n=1 Tax=Streptomyces sp. NPDC001604 TaxID=3364593 RepID=UPI0036B7C182
MVKQERAARTRRALIQAAAETFAGEGYVLASLPVISERAGVSKGALHFHFESKDALARAVEDEAARAVGRIIDAAQLRPGLTRLELLADVMRRLMACMAGDAVVRAGFRMDGDLTRKGSRAFSRRWQAWVGEVLRQAERDGELAEGVTSRAMTTTVVAATAGLRVLAASDETWRSAARVDQVFSVLLSGPPARQDS